MDFFLPSDIARLILGYLKENGYKKTHSIFLKECPHLQEYYKMLMDGRELQTTILGFSLILILEEWGRLKQENSCSYSNQTVRADVRRRPSVSPASARKKSRKEGTSPSKQQGPSTSPRWTPHVRFTDSQDNTQQTPANGQNCDEGENGYPMLKGLLDSFSKTGSNVAILPLTPENTSSQNSGNTSVQLYSPLKSTNDQANTSSVRDKNDSTWKADSCRSENGDGAVGQPLVTEVDLDTADAHPAENEKSERTGSRDESALTAIANSAELHSSLHKTPRKSTVPPGGAGPLDLVTPVKLFQGTVAAADNSPSSTRSPRRKKPKTPKKRSSDAGNLSGSEDVPKPAFKKLLEDNRLHEKLAQTCNSYLESINSSKDKEHSSTSPHTHPEEVDTVTNSKSLEEILDMDTNFVGDLISENIDMSDPAYESLFKLFGKEKEAFYEELRQEKKKTEDMAKEVEELEKSIQQEIEQYNSPLHSIEASSVASPDSVHSELSAPHPQTASSSQLVNACASLQPVSNCQDNNTASFLPPLRDHEFGSPLHSSSQKTNTDLILCSPSSVRTQPFSPSDYSQVCSPATPYSPTLTQPGTPTQNSSDPALSSASQPCALTNGFMSPQSHGPSTSRSVTASVFGSQVHQSTPVRQKHPGVLIGHCIPNCSPLAKADMNSDSPVMVQKNVPFTPKSTYTPHSRKNIFSPNGTNRHLFSPPAQIVPGSPLPQEQNGGVGNVETNQGNIPQFSEVPHNAAQNVSVHEQSFGYSCNANTVEVGNPGTSGFLANAGSHPCSTIANSIGCISLPPEEPEQPSKTTKGGRGAKGKGKTKAKRGLEQGSSTFSTLKNLLNKPAQVAGLTNAAPHLSMPDLLMPPGSPETAQLSDIDVQNQNIILLSPGGTSYKIPVLDCQDELGLQARDVSGTETINVWEADLNSSRQYSILPENQVTQCLVNSIEQGNSTEVLNKVQKKKQTEKSKSKSVKQSTKASKQGNKRKKSKKADKSGYFQSPSGSENKEDNTDSEAIYIASPLMFGKKAFVRNLDFGVDESRFRKIMPKPPSSGSSGTVIIVNTSTPAGTVTNSTGSSIILQAPGLASMSPALITTDSGHIEAREETMPSATEGFTNDCKTIPETSGDQKMTACDIIQDEDVLHAVGKDGNSHANAANESVVGAERDVNENDSFEVVSEESPSVESYKDWKGRMKTRTGSKSIVDQKKRVQTSTPLHVSDSGIDSDLPRQSMAGCVKHTDTPKTSYTRDVKQTQINSFFKRSSHRIAHEKSTKANLDKCNKDTNKNEKNDPKSKGTKSCNSGEQKTKQAGGKKSPGKKGGKAVLDSENNADDSSSFELSKSKRSSTRKSPRTNIINTDDTANSSCDIFPLSSPKGRRRSKDNVKSPKGSVLHNTSSDKGSRNSVKVTEKKPAQKPKGKNKQKKSLLKVKFTGHSGCKAKHKDTKQSKIVSSKQEVIELELEEEISDDDMPLCELKEKIHKNSPNKSVLSTPRKSPRHEFASPSKETLLEKVGLTPTKSVHSQEFKSPERANPLDILAEWQGSPASRKKSKGPITRNRLNKLNNGFKSPSPKTRSSARQRTARTPGRNLFKDSSDSKKVVEKKSSKDKSGKVTAPKSPVVSGKKSPVRTLFCETVEEITNKEVENVETECEENDKNEEEEFQTANISEDELKQALQSIEMEDFGSTLDNDDFNHETVYEDQFTAIKFQDRPTTDLQTSHTEVCEEEEFSNRINNVDTIPNKDGDCVSADRSENMNNSVNIDNATNVIVENPLTERGDGDSLRGEVTEEVVTETDEQVCVMPVFTEVVCNKSNVQKTVLDTDMQTHVNGEIVGHLSDRESRKEKKKKRHKEKKAKRHSLEADKVFTSPGGEMGVEDKRNRSGSAGEEGHSCSRGHNHHHHHKHHHHHHHNKHKKKKSKKRHREEDDESAERHKSKRQRFEASQALEIMDIDAALSQLYSSSIAAT